MSDEKKPLSERKKLILNAIVDAHISGGEPIGSMLAALIFGFAQALGIKVSATGVDSNLVAPIPYIVTIVSLVIFAINQRRKEKLRHSSAALQK